MASDTGRELWQGSGGRNSGGNNSSDAGGSSSSDEGVGMDMILAGHSAGATLSLHAGPRLQQLAQQQQQQQQPRVRAVVGVAGVYDFTALRDAHGAARAVYDSINTGLLGSENSNDDDDDDGWRGGWERGKVVGREWRADGVEVVVLGHGRADQLVDMAQAEGLARGFEDGGLGATTQQQQQQQRGEGNRPVVKLVECEGGHDEMVNGGQEIGRCVGVAVEALLGRSSSGVE